MTANESTTATSPYLTGPTAPVADEITVHDLRVTGTIPAELEGRWLRNGPNPLGETDVATHHWFMGDGMVHGVGIRGGKAEWYRNRWLRSDSVAGALGEPSRGGPSFGERDIGPNTSVGGFAGTTWAIVEAGGTPMEMTYDLDTVGRNDFYGTLEAGFTAHPKYDPATGELHAMCYAWPDLVDHIQYVVVGPDGRVTRTVDIPVPGMTMVHDMSLTKRYAVVYDLPVTVDFELAMQERFPFTWDNEYEARVGLLPRNGTADDIIWSPVDPCYVFHPVNAYDTDDGKMVIDVCRYERLFDTDILGPFGDGLTTLDRWTIDPSTRSVKEERVDDRHHEFPRHDPRVGTVRHRYGYTAGIADWNGTISGGATYKVDYDTADLTVHDHGLGIIGAEPVFIPREGSTAEDDGWIMVLAHDEANDAAELKILDATDIAAEPVARVHLPRRVPVGFHGNWVPDSSVPPPD